MCFPEWFLLISKLFLLLFFIILKHCKFSYLLISYY